MYIVKNLLFLNILLSFKSQCEEIQEEEPSITILPGSVYNYIGNTKFITAYIDLKLDLTCPKAIWENLRHIQDQLGKLIESTTVHTIHQSDSELKVLDETPTDNFNNTSEGEEDNFHAKLMKIYETCRTFECVKKLRDDQLVPRTPGQRKLLKLATETIPQNEDRTSQFKDEINRTHKLKVKGAENKLLRRTKRVKRENHLSISDLISEKERSLKLIYLALSEVKYLLEDAWITSWQQRKRTKRGWIDGIGRIFQQVFGTAMDSDMTAMHRKIVLLEDNNAGFHKAIEEITNQLKENDVSLNRVIDSVNHVIEAQEDMIIFRKNINTLLYRTTINEYITSVFAYTQVVNRFKEKITIIINTAINHHTPIQAYNFEALKPIIKDAQTKMKMNTLVEFTKENLNEFITLTWTNLDRSNLYSLTTLIPLSNNENFKSFEIIPFPTKMMNNYRIIFQPEYEYYFINQMNYKYTFLTLRQLKTCQVMNKLHACLMTNSMFSFENFDCAIQIYVNKSSEGTRRRLHPCKFIRIYDNLIYTRMIKTLTIISVNEERTGMEECGKDHKEIEIKDIYVLRATCTLRMQDRLILNPQHTAYNISMKYNIPEVSVYIRITNHLLTHDILNSSIRKLKHTEWNRNLDFINETLNSHTTELDVLPKSHISVSITIILILVIISVIIFIIHKRNRRLKEAVRGISIVSRINTRSKDERPDMSNKELTLENKRRKPKRTIIYNNTDTSDEEPEITYLPMSGTSTPSVGSPKPITRTKFIDKSAQTTKETPIYETVSELNNEPLETINEEKA